MSHPKKMIAKLCFWRNNVSTVNHFVDKDKIKFRKEKIYLRTPF